MTHTNNRKPAWKRYNTRNIKIDNKQILITNKVSKIIPNIVNKNVLRALFETGPDGAVVMSSANGLVDTGFASRYWLQLREDFLKG